MDYTLRKMSREEYPLLDDFLYDAIFVPKGTPAPPRSITARPELQVYVAGFGDAPGDACLAAEAGGRIVGAVWVRIMDDYGHIDDDTPSFAISVLEEYRGLGIGTALMEEMLRVLKAEGYRQASLAVQKANYAVRMYQKVGFEIVGENEEEYIMLCPLDRDRGPGQGAAEGSPEDEKAVSAASGGARPMRRSDRERGREFAYAVIDQCQYGVMSVSTGEETPYCVPLSLVRVGDDLFFHCALQGRKLDLLRQNPQVCVCFVTGTQPTYIAHENNYTTLFRSAVVTGAAFEVTDPAQKTAALRALCEKLLPGHMDGFPAAVAHSLSVTGVWGIHMAQAVGKEKAQKG